MTTPAPLSSPLVSCRLQPHPRTPCGVVDEIRVDIGGAAGDWLVVRYTIVGDLDRLSIPAAGASLDIERLWEHTCCEMFIAPGPGEDYVEWNFSPSGQIAHFAFSAYRDRIPPAPTRDASSIVTLHGRELQIEARVLLPPGIFATAFISLTMVVEDASGAFSYWALRHPREQPEFHDRGGFALALTLGPPIAIVHR